MLDAARVLGHTPSAFFFCGGHVVARIARRES